MRRNQLNAGIIMSGQQPDVVNALAQSSRAAAITNANRRTNRLHQTYQEHGPGILAGEENALNALARENLPQAFDVQKFNQQFSLQRESLDLRIKEFAHRASAEEREMAAREIESLVTSAIRPYQEGDLEGVNRALVAAGEPPIDNLEQYPAVASFFGDALKTLKEVRDFNAPAEPLSGPGKVQSDINNGLLPADTPLRGQGTTVNIGDVQQSAEAGVVDTSTIAPSDKFSPATPDATGTTGLVKGAANTVGEAVGAGQAFPEVDKAQTALTSLSTRSMLGLSEEFPGRPSNLTRERIEALTVKPSEITTGPGRALNKARDMVATIQESIDAANAVLLDPIYTQKDKAQAKTALRGLVQLYADYKGLEQSLAGANEGKNTTTSGVSWEVVE